jgi:hypothetical protein
VIALAWLAAAAALLFPSVPAGHPSLVPVPVGTGLRYRPPAPMTDGGAVAGMACAAEVDPAPVHVEVFLEGHAVVVPAGIGIAGAREQVGAYVTGGSCRYPLVTEEPTGVVWVGGTRTLGDLFSLWGQPLSSHRLLSGRGDVSVAVNGRRARGDPQNVPLAPGSQIVVQVGRRVPPHPGYRFPAAR